MQVFSVSLRFCRGVRGPPPEKFENQECRRSHLRPFCNAIKALRFVNAITIDKDASMSLLQINTPMFWIWIPYWYPTLFKNVQPFVCDTFSQEGSRESDMVIRTRALAFFCLSTMTVKHFGRVFSAGLNYSHWDSSLRWFMGVQCSQMFIEIKTPRGLGIITRWGYLPIIMVPRSEKSLKSDMLSLARTSKW